MLQFEDVSDVPLFMQKVVEQFQNAFKGKRPIIPELILHCTFHYLASGPFHDVHVRNRILLQSCLTWY
jgi:hypothetical protein